MRERVLLIDDDVSLTRVIELALEQEGYEVDVAHSGWDGLHQFHEAQPDLVILDVMMPQMNGWETCQRIREVSDVPIMMLTAKDGDTNELQGLRFGADQYTTKPLALPVLAARVKALLRRKRSISESGARRIVTVGDLTVDYAKQQASLGDTALSLSPKEFQLLACLASRPGEVISRAELLTDVWGAEYRGEDLYLKLYICYLRQKIEAKPSNPRYILTRRGVGYYLNDNPIPHTLSTDACPN